MIHASCHCGAVQLEIDAAPQDVTDCNCLICRRYGVLWAYYTPSQVRFAKPAATDSYRKSNSIAAAPAPPGPKPPTWRRQPSGDRKRKRSGRETIR